MNPEKTITPGPGGIAYGTYHEVIERELRASIERYFEFLWELHWKQKQGDESYLVPIEQRRLPVIILSCTLLECAINFYLCIKCDAKQFEKLDKKGLFEKWTEVPKQFFPNYNIQSASGLKEDLRKLIDRRKAIIHSKPMIIVDGGNQHKGNEPEIAFDEHSFIERCVTLPYRLSDNLFGGDMHLWGLHQTCGSVVNVFQRENRKFKLKTNIPRELILEIMEQGLDRETAITCAMMVQAGRKPDENGRIVLYPRNGLRVKIKPLKFLDKKQIQTD